MQFRGKPAILSGIPPLCLHYPLPPYPLKSYPPILTYQEYERTVYDWLQERHRRDPDFRFSTRQKASAGAGSDLFIGTEKSGYFSTTFWTIPVSYPGIAGDLIELRFRQRTKGLTYEFSIRCAREVDDPQNQANLELARSLREVDDPLWQRATSSKQETKFEQTIINAPEKNYVSIDDLLVDAATDLDAFLPIVDRYIEAVREQYPEYTAHRTTAEEFGRMQRLLADRRIGETSSAENWSDDYWSDGQPSDQLREDRPPYTAANNPHGKPITAPRNQIFYGPPGTGKTYETASEAVRITNPAFSVADRSRAEVRAEYQRLQKEGRIVFTTFHQSLSYEDFVEGIKPVLTNSDEAEADTRSLDYELQSGIFKQLVDTVRTANEAATNRSTRAGLLVDKQLIRRAQPYKMSLGDIREAGDRAIYDYCMTHNCITMGYGGDIDFTGVANEKEVLSRIRQQRPDGKEYSRYELTAVTTFAIDMKRGDLVIVPSGLQTIRAVGIVEGDYFFDAQAPILYSQFRKVRWLYRDISYPVRTVYGRQFSVQTVYAMDKSALEEGLLREHDHRPASNNYVLIIDEINRGNVSRIFGELITLLETDKRLGQPEALTVTLPYSRETFGVPDNLYLIATMNTADRSVEALDSALRRRFTFREITARPEVLAGREVAGVGLERLLGTINSRVERLLDKDHLIGHAYFLSMPLTIAGLREVFARQLIPLLEEYFFRDSHKLRLVLGNGFFTRLEEPAPFAPDTNEDFATDEPDYRLIDPATMSDEQFIEAIERLL